MVFDMDFLIKLQTHKKNNRNILEIHFAIVTGFFHHFGTVPYNVTAAACLTATIFSIFF